MSKWDLNERRAGDIGKLKGEADERLPQVKGAFSALFQQRADPNVLRRAGVDHAGVEIEIEPGHVFAEDFDLLSVAIEHALDRIGNHLAADALHGDRRQRVRRHDVAHQRIGLVADHDMAGLGDRLQARGEVRLGADDRIVHAVGAAEIADVAVAGIDAHADAERVLGAVARAISR